MSKRVQVVIASVSILGLAALFGCASFQDVITPCWVSEGGCDYADVNATSIMPYTTLFDARRVQMKMDYVHITNQTTESLEYEYHTGVNRFHITAAEEFQATFFSPEGPVGLLLPTLMGTGIGALLIKRPGDKSKKEVDLENGLRANNKV